tara:strand:+ start:89 stop:250 length:162 start_codon:yes stop_codon:yes gene_type:complete
MSKIHKLMGALYTGNKEEAIKAFDSAIDEKIETAVDVKRVAVAADIYNRKDKK